MSDQEDSADPFSENEPQFRMDFTMESTEVIDEDEDGVTVLTEMVPNPERYERIDEDDRTGWLDTHDNIFIPQEVLADSVEDDMEGTPIYHSPVGIDDFDAYCEDLFSDLYSVFEQDGGFASASPDNSILREYKNSSEEDTTFVILKADMVGSTKLSINTSTDHYLRTISAFEYVIVDLIRQHQGHYLGKEGDAIFGFFIGPNVNGKHDNAVLCSLRIRAAIREVLGTVLRQTGHSDIDVSIGMDTGRPNIVSTGDGDYDLMGLTMNLSSKIEDVSEPGEILLGEFTEGVLHTTFRQMTTEVTEEREWSIPINDRTYRIYSLENSE